MNILLVTGRFPQRSETFIYRKALALARRGHHVTLLSRSAGDWGLYPEPLPSNLNVEVVPPDSMLRSPGRVVAAMLGAARHAAREHARVGELWERCHTDPRTRTRPLQQLIRHLPYLGRRPDVVHFEFLGAAAMHPFVGAITGAPVIASCRGQDVHMLPIRDDEIRARHIETLRAVDGIHCVSDELARCVTRLTGRVAHIWVNRPAVDLATIAPRLPGRAPGPLRIVASGRLVWVKGFDYLLAALAIARARGIAFHAEILGAGELAHALRSSIDDLGLSDVVTLVGGVGHDEALSHVSAADVFVLSSVEEGISNAALEAMALGVAVVTTSAGGMSEAVRDGIDGFVVPIRDARAIADRIEALARDPARCSTLGAAGRARAAAEFDLTRQIDAFEAMYRALASARTVVGAGR